MNINNNNSSSKIVKNTDNNGNSANPVNNTNNISNNDKTISGINDSADDNADNIPTNNNNINNAKKRKQRREAETTHALQKFILANYPTVSLLKLPDHELCEELTREYGKDAVKYTLDNMENYTGLERKYKDAGVTLRAWLIRGYS